MSTKVGSLQRHLLRCARRQTGKPQAHRAFHVSAWRAQEARSAVQDGYEITQASSIRGTAEAPDAHGVTLTIAGKKCTFPALFLRDACRCSQCVDPSTQQKLFQTSDIPSNLEAVVQSPSAEGALRLSWKHDHPSTAGQQHITELPGKWLREANVLDTRLRTSRAPLRKQTFWDSRRMHEDNLWVDYEEYATSDNALLQTLRQLSTHGLVFLRNVPDDETSVISITERIGPLRDSFYGRTWNVRSVPDAKNIAYTDQYLGLHMDLLYMTNPPHLQFLHSLRAQAPGGESLFSDSFYAAEVIRRTRPELFTTLVRAPVTYHYQNASQHYVATRPTIELELGGIVGGQGGCFIDDTPSEGNEPSKGNARQPDITSAISRINWSPPFQGPFQQEISHLPAYHQAAHLLNGLVNAEENVFEYRMAEGECVIFDNRRVLHARKAFDINGGERWLKGAYVDDDVYWSRLRVLEEAAA